MGAPRRRTRPDDHAVSDTLGVVLMVAISVAMAGGLYVYVFGFGTQAEAPAALGLTSARGISPTGTKTYTVSSAQSDVLWNDLVLQVDGKRLAYDDALAGGLKFCVATGSGSCLDDATWAASATPVQAGHTLYVHDSDLVDRNLQVIDAQSGVMVLMLPLGGMAT